MSENSVENIFSKIYVVYFSFYSTNKEANLFKALATEQNFKGVVTDIATILEHGFFDEKTICSINFPYFGLSCSLSLDILKSPLFQELHEIGGFMTSLPRYDVTRNRWGVIRDYLKALSETMDKNIHVAIDANWMNDSNDLSKFFSLIAPYPNLWPIISCYTAIKKVRPGHLMEWAKIAKNSSIKPVGFFGPPPSEVKFVAELINSGFNSLGIPPNLAIQFITSN